MNLTRLRPILGILIPAAIVLLICANAMRITSKDNRCTNQGGHLEFAARAPGEVCVMPDGSTIDP